MECVCGGIIEFCKDFKNGNIASDIEIFKCSCGRMVYVKNGILWGEWFPIDLDNVTNVKIK